MIANPFVDCQTMEAAAEVAGFEFRTPEQVEGISEKKIQAVDQEMIQVIYSADENQILIRKAPGTRNISGDYNNYQKEETITVDERQVTLKGNDGVIALATWSANDYSYSIYVSAGMAQWLALCGGFVLPGGGDVAPTYYGQSPVPQLTSTDRLRDNVELTLCRAAAQHKKPLLGICRGAQVLNVAFGGTLWQDIPAQCRAAICHYQDSAARGELFHSLTLAPDSLLARIMGPGQHECNTFHHQAVRDVAPGFAAAAHAPDGLVEAVESADGLALGVQWHPENLAPEHPDHAAIFTWLVDAAAGGALLKR